MRPTSPLTDAPTPPPPASDERSLIRQSSQSFTSRAAAANAPAQTESDTGGFTIPSHITGYVHSSDIQGSASLKKLETVTSHNLRVTDKKADERFAALEKFVRTEVSMLSIALDRDGSGIDVSKRFGELRGLISDVQLQVKVLRKGAPDSRALMEVDLRIEELHNRIDDLSTRLPSQDLLDNLLATLGRVETKVDEVDSRATKMDAARSRDIKDLAADLKGLDAKVLSCSKTLLATTDVVKDWHDTPRVRRRSPSPDIVEVHAPAYKALRREIEDDAATRSRSSSSGNTPHHRVLSPPPAAPTTSSSSAVPPPAPPTHTPVLYFGPMKWAKSASEVKKFDGRALKSTVTNVLLRHTGNLPTPSRVTLHNEHYAIMHFVQDKGPRLFLDKWRKGSIAEYPHLTVSASPPTS